MIVVSCDPGKGDGAFAAMDETAQIIGMWDMPVIGNVLSEVGVAAILRPFIAPDTVFVIEKVGDMGKGQAAMFEFGLVTGVPRGAAAMAGMTIVQVAPHVWKKDVGLPALKKNEGESTSQFTSRKKELSRSLAINLWPASYDLLKLKKNAGRAEAALIGRWHLLHNRRALIAAA